MGACWQRFFVNPKIFTRVISILLIKQLALDVWNQLPSRGRVLEKVVWIHQTMKIWTLSSEWRLWNNHPCNNRLCWTGAGGSSRKRKSSYLSKDLDSGQGHRPDLRTGPLMQPLIQGSRNISKAYWAYVCGFSAERSTPCPRNSDSGGVAQQVACIGLVEGATLKETTVGNLTLISLFICCEWESTLEKRGRIQHE